MRYSLKTGKFGMYFYDNHSNLDIDLSNALEKLNRLSQINEILKLRNIVIILCNTCFHSLGNCSQSDYILDTGITFDYCSEYCYQPK